MIYKLFTSPLYMSSVVYVNNPHNDQYNLRRQSVAITGRDKILIELNERTTLLFLIDECMQRRWK